MKVFSTFFFLLLSGLLVTSCGSNVDTSTKVYITINDYTYQYLPGAEIDIPVKVSVHGENKWHGPVKVFIKKDEILVVENEVEAVVESNSEQVIHIPIILPKEIGTYQVVAQIITPDGSPFLNRKLIEIVNHIRRLDL